jgi:hypothetical protein
MTSMASDTPTEAGGSPLIRIPPGNRLSCPQPLVHPGWMSGQGASVQQSGRRTHLLQFQQPATSARTEQVQDIPLVDLHRKDDA